MCDNDLTHTVYIDFMNEPPICAHMYLLYLPHTYSRFLRTYVIYVVIPESLLKLPPPIPWAIKNMLPVQIHPLELAHSVTMETM